MRIAINVMNLYFRNRVDEISCNTILREIFQKRAKEGEALLTTPCLRFMRECAGLKPEQGTT